jgi:hypothetical protein
MCGKSFISATLLIAVLAPLSLRSASAQVIPLTGRQLAAGSPHVVVAMVEGARSRWTAERTLIVTEYRLRIEDRLKGDAPERLILTIPGGTVGRETHGTSVSTPLAIGARYLLFLGDPERPTFTPITGGWQGMFRETAGLGGKREFEDLARAARDLIAAVEESPEPADTAWLVWSEEPDLPAKAYQRSTLSVSTSATAAPARSGEAKFVVRNAALAPIVFNTLLPGTRFSSQDQKQMAYWNLYAGDLFRISPNPSPDWAFGNGVFDIAGFPSSEQMQQQFDLTWGSGAYALTAWRLQDDHIIEADLAFNPAFEWTVADELATRLGGPLSFKDTLLSALGKAWGYRGPIDLFGGGLDPSPVTRDSIMNLKAAPYDLATLYAEDAAAARATYGGPPLRDGVISSYGISPSPFTPFYEPVRPSVATAAAGQSLVLLKGIKIENTGTVDLTKLTVEVYLVPRRFSLDGAILLRKVRIGGTIPPGEVRNLSLGRIKLPSSVPAGTYYFAFVLRDPKDAHQANNRAWSNDDVKVAVR